MRLILINILCIQFKGESISWKLVHQLYHTDSGATTNTPGLSIVPKLKYEHLFLTSFSKMRVDLAAEVSLQMRPQ